MGILVNTGFDVGSSSPIDSRAVKNTTNERDALVTDGLVYENLKVYCKDTQTEYRWTGTDWEEVGTGGTVDLSEYAKIYTTLDELGLTETATIQDVIDAMSKGSITLLGARDFTNYKTILPYEEKNDQFARIYIVKGTASGSSVYARWFRKDGTKEAIAIFDINYNTFSGWVKLPNDTRVTTLETQVNELFQSVSNGKTLVANAITGKGVSTATDATFATMATNISKITNYTASEKKALATAITNKGVSTSSTASFSTMATNIGKISVSGYTEETKSYTTTSSGITPLTITFSANVLGVKQVIPPTYSSRITTQTSADMFTINGKELILYVTGEGTWKVTALIEA